MTELNQQPQQMDETAAKAFDESVSAAVLKVFNLNSEMMVAGTSPVAVALANALCAADMTAAMVVEHGGKDMTDITRLLTNMADDMQKRAVLAFEYYSQQKAEREKAVAEVAEAANDAAVTA